MRIDPYNLERVDLGFEEGEAYSERAHKALDAAGEIYDEWTAAPPADNNELERPKLETTPFASPLGDEPYKELVDTFRAEFPGRVYLNSGTGLPGYLFCDFANSPLQGASPEEHAQMIMDQYSLTLSGRKSGEISVARAWDVAWEGVFRQTRHLRFVQNVWGGAISFTFDSMNRLALITTSLYPVSDEELSLLERGDPAKIGETLAGKVDGLNGVPQNIGFGEWSPPEARGFCYFPFQRRRERFDKDHLWEYADGEWRMPRFEQDAKPNDFVGEFRPAWIVRFIDIYGEPWFGFVDVVKHGLLHWLPTKRSASVDYAVFSTAQEAIDFEPVLAGGNNAHIQQWIFQHGLKKPIWLGANAKTLRQASRVHPAGGRLKDPEDNMDRPLVEVNRPERYLGASVIYHAKETQLHFRSLLSQASISGWMSDQTNPLNNQDVVFEDIEDRPYYDLSTRIIHFPRGRTGTHPVHEPGYDGEVIAHEVTHAVMHAFFGQIFVTDGTEEQEVAAQAFDEGLAFYAACDYFDNPQWAEYAYADWQVWRDVAAVDLRYDTTVAIVTNPLSIEDPSGIAYAIGMWWARVLWEFRLQFPAFNVVLLRVLHSLTRIQPTTQTAGGSYYEQIRDAFRIVGAAIRDHLVQNTGNSVEVEEMRSHVTAILADAGIEPR